MLLVAVPSFGLATTMTPRTVDPPAKVTWLGASIRMTPSYVPPPLKVGLAPAWMRMFDRYGVDVLPVMSVSLPTRYETNQAGSATGNSGAATSGCTCAA